jgi:hypothetical protein
MEGREVVGMIRVVVMILVIRRLPRLILGSALGIEKRWGMLMRFLFGRRMMMMMGRRLWKLRARKMKRGIENGESRRSFLCQM